MQIGATNRLPDQPLQLTAILCLLAILSVQPAWVAAAGGSDPYAASVGYAGGTFARPGQETTLYVLVRNVAAKRGGDWIAAIVVDFSHTKMVPLHPGRLPVDWQGRIEQGTLITYTAGHGASAVHGGETVRLRPRVRNPLDPGAVALPRIIIVPLSSMQGFEGPTLRALERVPFVEVRPTGKLVIKR